MKTGGEAVSSSEEAVVENPQGAGAETAPASSGTEQAPRESDSGEQAQEFVKDEEGNEYIPRKAFEARLAKMAEQKNTAYTSLLETLRNDPMARQQFMEAMGANTAPQAPAQSPTTPKPSLLKDWMAPLPPEHQAHYDGLVKGIMADVNEQIASAINKAIEPILSHVGSEKVKSFSQINKDFNKYQETVYNLMQSRRVSNLEDAYKIASYDDKIKGATASKPSTPPAKAPIQGSQRSPMGIKSKGPGGLRAALERAAQETGYIQE